MCIMKPAVVQTLSQINTRGIVSKETLSFTLMVCLHFKSISISDYCLYPSVPHGLGLLSYSTCTMMYLDMFGLFPCNML